MFHSVFSVILQHVVSRSNIIYPKHPFNGGHRAPPPPLTRAHSHTSYVTLNFKLNEVGN